MPLAGGGLAETELAVRIENALALGALGDLRGSSLEGVPVGERQPVPLGGSITDDTILTLATASAIADVGAVDPVAIAQEFVAAFETGIPGLGSSTLGALQALRAGQHWALSGIGGERAAGNGAAMRIAPVAFVVDPAESESRQLIRDVARITHRNDEASVGALALAIGLRVALDGFDGRGEALTSIAAALPDTLVRDAVVAASNLGDASASEAASVLGSSGFVAESVPLALFVGLSEWSSPESAINATVLAAEDADTVASMVGQLLGAAGHQIEAKDRAALGLAVDLEMLALRLAAIAYGG